MKLSYLEQALAASRKGTPAAIATNLVSGQQSLVLGSETSGNLPVDDVVRDGLAKALAEDRSTTIETASGAVFIEVFNPPLRCFIIGAVHIAQPLARMAAMLDYRVTVIDPRTAFATDARFPEIELSTEWPDEALQRLKPDKRSAVITLTHDPKLDDPALTEALKSQAFFIGALGSRKTHAGRLRRLAEAGFKEADVARIHGPVGLNIGAISPAEIAVAILGQVTSALRADRLKQREAA
ncbi:MAG TPA: XdhC family protein [Stellaceae bacterium]|jgi:xanthine dehydrogenase accessory factor|nr:XdhC family protein [Stellaceae bacterium]